MIFLVNNKGDQEEDQVEDQLHLHVLDQKPELLPFFGLHFSDFDMVYLEHKFFSKMIAGFYAKVYVKEVNFKNSFIMFF